MTLGFLMLTCISGLMAFTGRVKTSMASPSFLESFELSDVQLHSNTFQYQHQASNLEYLLNLEPDRMLYVFRKNANLSTLGAEPFHGTWEDPWCELRGHFVGHYLTALSYAVLGSNGNATLVSRLKLYIHELKVVQDALDEEGYLSAFPSEHIDRVENLKGVWAPYYVIHKIMCGLIDAYSLGKIPLALTIVRDMASYFYKRSKALVKAKGEEHWQATLRTEYGGMNEVLYRLYGLTKDPTHLEFATMFDKKEFVTPLVQKQDHLAGLHANTHLAQVVGLAEKVEVVDKDGKEGNEAMEAVSHFFTLVGTGPHSYATGGSNVKEFWFPPSILGEAITDRNDSLETQEICTQYNILKIARSLFRWTVDVRLADFYERALVNGILGVSRLNNDQVNADEAHHHHNRRHRRSHQHSSGSISRDLNEGLRLESGFSDRHRFRSAEIRSSQDTTFNSSSSLSLDGSSAIPPHRRPFVTRSQDYWGFSLEKMKGHETADNSPGTPGSFLYLLPMGSGQSKRDNFHHWGYPFHSFWCCYGTAIESFAKLADSIYFKEIPAANSPDPPKLYINQFVGSILTWKDLHLSVNMTVDTFAASATTTASIQVLLGEGKETVSFSMLVRVPQWADQRTTQIRVNGEPWRRCPSHPSPSSYCTLARTWAHHDTVDVLIGLGYWWKGLPDVREEYQGLTALMMGPYVMAGHTHDGRGLEVHKSFTSASSDKGDKQAGHLSAQTSSAASQVHNHASESSSIKAREDLSRRLSGMIHDPQEEIEHGSIQLLSLQAAWNASLFLRHDLYHAHMSNIEDGGDAIDATFKLIKSCPLNQSSGNKDARKDEAILLESMNFPGFYLGFLGSDKHLTLTQLSRNLNQNSCSDHQFIIHKTDGLISLESLSHPGGFISASSLTNQSCGDSKDTCSVDMHAGLCISQPARMRVFCRKSCGSCSSIASALHLVQMNGASPESHSSSLFKMVQPLTSRYPPGSKVIEGVNRKYLVTPLGRLVDERYTVYFNVKASSSSHKQL